ncbi:MAG: DivIVA domain-containing protein, partial [Solirubrobacterales bacterium]|nr:DivIVA domain-containing protein [Solirubrobacterales bacterium]
MSALALDRQSIEKKDFPISRRGYEPEAVDVHLESLAGEVERLQRELERAQRAAASAPNAAAAPAASPVQSLALAASEQVRLIVDAAESSAADIERVAQEEAARIRADADTEAQRVREEAVGRSQDHVGQVGEATSTMLQRMDAMESELGSLLDGLRTGTSRLTADLSLLQGNLGDLYGAAGSSQAPAPPRADT